MAAAKPKSARAIKPHGGKTMKSLGFTTSFFAAGALALALPAVALAGAADLGQGQAVVTVMPKNNSETPLKLQPQNLQPQDLQVKLNGNASSVTGWTPARGARSPLELVLLIDGSARSSLGTQLGEIEGFVKEMPSHTKMTIAYMQNGRAALEGPLSSDPAAVLKGLRLPSGGPGTNGSPYFCLSDLAKNWPSTDRAARREVVMITDGVDNYNPGFDPNNPYVQSAIHDSVRAGLVVYSIYWSSRGRLDASAYINNAGQSLLNLVTSATGGTSYWQGTGNPVSFEPYFKDLRVRFENQYLLSFTGALRDKAQVQSMKLKVGGLEAKVYFPQQVYLTPEGASAGE